MIKIPSTKLKDDDLYDEDESFDRQLLSTSIFSFFSPRWLASILRLRKNKKYENASYSLIDHEDTERSIKRLEGIIENYFREDHGKSSNIVDLDTKIQHRSLCISIMFETIAGILLFVTPIFILPSIVTYMKDEIDGTRVYIGILLMIAFIISEILAIFFSTNADNNTILSGIKIKAAISTMIFRKTLEMKKFEEVSAEKILKLMSDSVQSLIGNSSIIYNNSLTVIFQIIATIAYSFYALGLWAFLSCFLLLAFYLIQFYLQKIKVSVNKRTLTNANKQLDFLRNISTVLKLIKMHNWEDLILKSISDSRKLQLSCIIRELFLSDIFDVLCVWIPIGAYSLTLIGYVLMGNTLSPILVFVLIVLYYRLSLTLYVIFKHFNNIIQSLKILQETVNFLIMKPSLVDNPDEPPINHHPIILSNVTFSSNNTIMSETQNEDELTEILNIENQASENIFNFNLSVEQGKIFGVCGKKGSGKTALLLAILGELKLISGERKITGEITFLAEENWLFPGTIQENILFGSLYSEERYQKCVFASTLTADLQHLHKKDETKISEKESLNNLIQKKICLARTLYRDSQIYLLDEPFSILDADIINHFITHGIQDILKNKTIIVSTHMLKNIENYDQILYMSNGGIMESGTHEKLIEMNGEYAELIKRYEATNRENEILKPSISNDTFILNNSVDAEASLEIVDESERRNPNFTKMYLNYLKHSGFIMTGLLGLLYIFYQTIACFNSSFLGQYLTDEEYQNSSNATSNEMVNNTHEDGDFYIFPLGLTVALLLLTGIFRSCVFSMNSLLVSKKLHKLIFKKLLKSSLKYFEENPFGMIVERFSNNLKLVDFQLPEIHLSYLNHLLVYVGSWLQIIVIQNFAVIPLIIGQIVKHVLDKCYHTTWKNSKKMQFLTTSKFFDYMASVNKGLMSIRSFKNEKYFDNKFQELCYVHLESRALRLLFKQWYFFVLNCLVICFVAASGLIIIILDEEPSTARVALAFTCSLLVISYSKMYLRLQRDLEDGLIGIEIMQQCIKEIPLEENNDVAILNRPPKNWPQDGGILFQNVSVQYDGYSPPLRNISFMLKPKEKVGLIGKKGAGKSNIVAALFRLLNISTGKVFIDGVDISSIYLKHLRSKMSVSLKESHLLPGSIRYNLDPFNKYDELKIWSVLERLQLKQWVLSMDKHLDTIIKHMAFKKRQLLSLGRMLLKEDKIIILELAQDSDNDSLIESIITQEFSNSTVIILTTNIRLLQRCDRIILLDGGEILENGPSHSILFNENSSIKSSILDILLSNSRS